VRRRRTFIADQSVGHRSSPWVEPIAFAADNSKRKPLDKLRLREQL
jgi:hypothetical protein